MSVEWVGNSAFFQKGDIRYKVACKADGEVMLTVDGKWLFPDGLANTSASEVKSRKKREPKAAQPVVESDELNLDDI